MMIVEAHPVDGTTERLCAAKTLIPGFIMHFSYLDVLKFIFVPFCISSFFYFFCLHLFSVADPLLKAYVL